MNGMPASYDDDISRTPADGDRSDEAQEALNELVDDFNAQTVLAMEEKVGILMAIKVLSESLRKDAQAWEKLDKNDCVLDEHWDGYEPEIIDLLSTELREYFEGLTDEIETMIRKYEVTK